MDYKNKIKLSKKRSLEFYFQQYFYLGGVKKNIKNVIALFCVSEGVEPGNDFFVFFLIFFNIFPNSPRIQGGEQCEEEFKLAWPRFCGNSQKFRYSLKQIFI